MTAADKIADARALIEPLTGHTPGPWQVDAPEDESVEITARIFAIAGLYETAPEALPDARLIAAAPALRETVAALADLADAQAQEIARLRAENERLRNMALLARFSEVFAGSHRHIKSGGLYDHIGTGRIQSEQPLADMDAVEIYIGVSGDLWARRQSEFHDGRFNEISPALGDAP